MKVRHTVGVCRPWEGKGCSGNELGRQAVSPDLHLSPLRFLGGVKWGWDIFTRGPAVSQSGAQSSQELPCGWSQYSRTHSQTQGPPPPPRATMVPPTPSPHQPPPRMTKPASKGSNGLQGPGIQWVLMHCMASSTPDTHFQAPRWEGLS